MLKYSIFKWHQFDKKEKTIRIKSVQHKTNSFKRLVFLIRSKIPFFFLKQKNYLLKNGYFKNVLTENIIF